MSTAGEMDLMGDIHAVIVDDSEVGVKVLANLLEVNHVSFTAIQDPRQASRVLSELQQVDVIFLDLEMPHLSGIDLLTMIKQDLGLSVPVIAYTVHTSEIDQMRQVGFDGFLGKPLKMRDFSQQLQDILGGLPVWTTN